MAEQSFTTQRINGIFYQGDTIEFSIPAGANAYNIQDINGNAVSFGSVSTGATVLTPTVPAGGWKNGWYFLAATGPSSYYGYFPFSIANADARFNTAPVWGTSDTGSDPWGEGANQITWGISAIGAMRWSVRSFPATNDVNAIKSNLTFQASWGSTDTVRKPVHICAFPNGAVDSATIGSIEFFRRGTRTDGISLTTSAGTTTGTVKLVVTDTTTSTAVETYDNCYTESQLQEKVNASSTWLYAGGGYNSTNVPTIAANVAIANTNTTGAIAAVQALYNFNSVGITYFEGPFNEPNTKGDHLVAAAAAFQSIVHAANASAKAVVPAWLAALHTDPNYQYDYGSLNQVVTDWEFTQLYLSEFIAFAQAIGFTPDAFSIHPYNQLDLADIPSSTYVFKFIKDLEVVWPSMPVFLTEYGDFVGEYGIYHPTIAATWMVYWLTFIETVGIPKEHFYYFYSTSHGFGSYPSWVQNDNGSLNPYWMAARGVSERLYGTTFVQRLSFSDPIDKMLFAAQWQDATNNTYLFQVPQMSSASLVLSVTGVTTVNVYDWAGNETVANVVNGQISLTVPPQGIWVVAPNAASISVAEFENGLYSKTQINLADRRVLDAKITFSSTSISDGLKAKGLGSYNPDPQGADRLGLGNVPWFDSTFTVPSDLTVSLPSAQSVGRMLIIGPPPYTDGLRNALTGFEVQYQSTVGGSWVTLDTYTSPSISTYSVFPNGYWSWGSGVSMFAVHFWDCASIFDVTFTPVTAVAVRLHTVSTSIGNWPTPAAATLAGAHGAGTASEGLYLRFIGIYAS